MKEDLSKNKGRLLIKRYQLEHLVPLILTILSVYFWFSSFRQGWVYFIGLFINILGLIIWWLAKFALSDNWNAGYGKPIIKKLVTNGIYSKISHPLYLGINLTLAGQCLIHLNIFLIIPSLVIIIYFFWRMKIETKFLTKTLGKKYLDYRNKTWI
jgi:protein-S-isoprenylcysteine O-methyltransferase Ste14